MEENTNEIYYNELKTLVEYGEMEFKIVSPMGETLTKLLASMLTCNTKEMKDVIKRMCYGIIDTFNEMKLEDYNLK